MPMRGSRVGRLKPNCLVLLLTILCGFLRVGGSFDHDYNCEGKPAREFHKNDGKTKHEDLIAEVSWDEPNPPSWGLDRLDQLSNYSSTSIVRKPNLDSNYHYEYTGQGVVVFVLDTGVRSTHAEFRKMAAPQSTERASDYVVESSRLVACVNFVDPSDATCADEHGHGTFTAALIGGTVYGVAKQVSMVIIKVMNQQGRNPSVNTLVKALSYVQEYKKNHSDLAMVAYLGFSLTGLSSDLNHAVEATVQSQVTVVVPAGNNGINACLVSPAAATSALTIGATQEQDRRYWKSNVGPCVDLFAPGQNVVSAGFNGDTAQAKPLDGTSLAAAHVAGVVALILEQYPTWTPEQVRDTLLKESEVGVIRNVGSNSPNYLVSSWRRKRPILSEQLRLLPDILYDSMEFGRSVALYGTTLAVGAPLALIDDSFIQDGAVYVFAQDEFSGSWTQQAKITSSDPQGSHNFGWSIALDGDTLVVGTPWDNDKGDRAGSVYVICRVPEETASGGNASWVEQMEIHASDATSIFQFGEDVALDVDTLVVGSPGHNLGRSPSPRGAAYVYVRTNAGTNLTSWTEVAFLSSNDTEPLDNFGYDVAVSGDVVVVGAFLKDERYEDQGVAYIFLRDQDTHLWLLHEKYVAGGTLGGAHAYLGSSVDIHRETILLGSFGDSPIGSTWSMSGSALILRNPDNESWIQEDLIVPNDPTAAANFGRSVDLSGSGDIAVMGAPGESNLYGETAGSAYVFARGRGTAWQQLYKLLPSAGNSNDEFGWSVAVDGDFAVVGAHYMSIGPVRRAGAVFLYSIAAP